MKIKLTKQEKNWILYDVGNSAFTLLAATILPIYFNYIAGKQGLSDVQYLAYWGYAVSIATLLTALAGPVFGTVADTKGYKKPVFTIALGNCFSRTGICKVLAGLSGSFCHCKGRIFRNAGIL